MLVVDGKSFVQKQNIPVVMSSQKKYIEPKNRVEYTSHIISQIDADFANIFQQPSRVRTTNKTVRPKLNDLVETADN